MDLDRILGNEELREQVLAKLESDEIRERLGRASVDPDGVRGAAERTGGGLESATPPEYEAIIRRIGRPVLYIQGGVIQEPELDYWKPWIARARETLAAVIPSVGRIELLHHPSYEWVGTGWVVAPGIVVTNRHVAEIFARRSGGECSFRLDDNGNPYGARIDFREEHQRRSVAELRVSEVLYIEEDRWGSPDIAFLRVEAGSGEDQGLPPPIRLAPRGAEEAQVVGCIGYAAWDGRRNDPEWMREIFDDVYDVKRLHPGQVMSAGRRVLTHDCSTLGGNSGSVVLDLSTGRAVGLHFAGRFGKENYAVQASVVRDRLDAMKKRTG